MCRRTVPVLAAAVLLAGCATHGNYYTIVASWLGAPSDDVVRVWGAPDSTYKLRNGHEILVYEDASASTMPTTVIPGQTTVHRTNGSVIAQSSPTTVSGGETRLLTCRTEFEVDAAGTVVGWRARGDDCIAQTPEKDSRFRR